MTGSDRHNHGGGAQSRLAFEALEAMGELVLVRDAGGRVVHVNGAFLEAFGGSRDDWIGRWFALAPSGGSHGHRRFEALMRTRGGSIWLEWDERPTEDGGAIAVGRDVTSRRDAVHDLEAAQRAKSRFFASVTHELRTPLAGALGMARLLTATDLKPDQASYVDALTGSASHALSLIDDILDLSRLEAGKMELRPTEIDLRQLARETIELAAPRAHDKGLEIALVFAAGSPGRVTADAARLKQILFNLIGNAVKFTDQGGVRVDIGFQPGSAPRRGPAPRLVFSVRDTGPGIAKEDQASLFEDFERGAAETNGAESGAGLGLATVRRLVTAMEGEIGVESAPGRGSNFWASLPLPVLSTCQDRPLEGRRVAVATPDATLRLALADQVRSLGGAPLAIADPAQIPAAGEGDLLVDRAWLDHLAPAAEAAAAPRAWILVRPDEKDEIIAALPDNTAGWLVKPVRDESLVARLTGAAPDRAPADQPAPAPTQTALSGCDILLAEDDPVNALIARKLVEALGADVDWVKTGEAARQALLGAKRYDAALIDQRMPEMNGPDVARAVREAGRRTPMIALTANATEADRSVCLEAGMDDFLTKPVDPDRLAETLVTLCRPQKHASIA